MRILKFFILGIAFAFQLNAAVPSYYVTDISDINFETKLNGTDSAYIYFSGLYLKGNVQFSINGIESGQFSMDKNSVTPLSGSVVLDSVKVKFSPTIQGTNTALFTAISQSADTVYLNLIGKASIINSVNNISDHFVLSSIRVNGSNVQFQSQGGLLVELYSMDGRLVSSTTSVEGLNSIPCKMNSPFILRVGTRVFKLGRQL